MKVIAYQFNYPKNTKTIPVPTELQSGGFEVILIKTNNNQNHTSLNNINKNNKDDVDK